MKVRRLKLVFLGPGGVGKTSLCMRLSGHAKFSADLPATDGVAVTELLLHDSASSKRVRIEVKHMVVVVG